MVQQWDNLIVSNQGYLWKSFSLCNPIPKIVRIKVEIFTRLKVMKFLN